MENIKSFFIREEELSAKPKTIPDAASEIYERPSLQGTPSQPLTSLQRIIEKPLPQNPPTLPFSPDELRAALKVPKEQKPTPPPVERDITHEIIAFEDALKDAHKTVAVETQKPTTRTTSTVTAIAMPSTAPAPLEKSFFSEFEQFVTNENLEADSILEKDILWRMKEFHRHRNEGNEYYLYSKDVQTAVQRRIAELKGLEREWFEKREAADALEKDVELVEREIESRTSDLKSLLMRVKAKSRLERMVSPGQEFVVADGRRLTSLLDLKHALQTMTDTVFSVHVSATRNDFASWVRGALQDNALADQLGTIRERQQLEIFLNKLT